MTTATIKDFTKGTTLITSEGWKFILKNNIGGGLWEAKGESGEKIIDEGEARFYNI